jgi:hypothetical protein
MKRFITALFLILATATTAMAQQIVDDYALLVNVKDGKILEYRFNIEPVISFSDKYMVLQTNEDAPLKFILDDVDKLTFSGKITGIDKVVDKSSAIRISVSAGAVLVDGLKPADKVSLYGANGALLFSVKADTQGRATINVSRLATGVYVVYTPTNSFKFTK